MCGNSKKATASNLLPGQCTTVRRRYMMISSLFTFQDCYWTEVGQVFQKFILEDGCLLGCSALVNSYQSTWHYNPEDSHLHSHRRENLKSYQVCSYLHSSRGMAEAPDVKTNAPITLHVYNFFESIDSKSQFIRTVTFHVLTAASMKKAVFWFVVPCSLAEIYRRFITVVLQ
jgi:hypothetical protein